MTTYVPRTTWRRHITTKTTEERERPLDDRAWAVEDQVEDVRRDEPHDQHPGHEGLQLLGVEAERARATLGEPDPHENGGGDEHAERVDGHSEEVQIVDMDVRKHRGEEPTRFIVHSRR